MQQNKILTNFNLRDIITFKSDNNYKKNFHAGIFVVYYF